MSLTTSSTWSTRLNSLRRALNALAKPFNVIFKRPPEPRYVGINPKHFKDHEMMLIMSIAGKDKEVGLDEATEYIKTASAGGIGTGLNFALAANISSAVSTLVDKTHWVKPFLQGATFTLIGLSFFHYSRYFSNRMKSKARSRAYIKKEFTLTDQEHVMKVALSVYPEKCFKHYRVTTREEVERYISRSMAAKLLEEQSTTTGRKET